MDELLGHDETEDEDPTLTRHATLRMAERRISTCACEILLAHGDLRTPSRGSQRRRLSRGAGRRLERQGRYARHFIVEARELELILASGERVVTMYRHPADMRFRRSGVRPDARRLWRNREDME